MLVSGIDSSMIKSTRSL